MPSTLYQSVKNSVLEYAQIKKRNQRKQDKLLFKWKLISLILAIVLIVLIGVFSQLLQTINNIPDVTSDKSYVLPLMKQLNTQSVQNLTHANNLIAGITVKSDDLGAYFEWNEASQLYSNQDLAFNLSNLITSINNNEELLFIFSYQFGPTNISRFGLRAHKGYNEEIKDKGLVIVQDNTETRYSSIFNINTGYNLTYDVIECNLFSKTNTTLTVFQSIKFTDLGVSTQLTFDILKPSCFSTQNATEARTKLAKVTGMDLSPVTDMSAFMLEVYSLSLNEEAENQM